MIAADTEIRVRGEVAHKLFQRYLSGDFEAFEREQLFEGPAGTGKSFGIGLFLDMVARDWPGCRILVVRKTRVSLSESWMVTFEEHILGPFDPVRNGPRRSHRTAYEYPNGAMIVMGGMDNPTRLFSTEYDIIYVNEACEFAEEEIESLHRALRHSALPFQCMLMDCNPDAEFHWLNQRAMPGGRTARRCTTLKDNPAYWAYNPETGEYEWTQRGASYREGLMQGTSGVRYRRLVQGLWTTAEGVIIPLDPDEHVLDGTLVIQPFQYPRIEFGDRDSVELRWFYAAMDFGFRNPGAVCVFGVTADRTRYLVREAYQTKKSDEWWCDLLVKWDSECKFHRVVCDSAEPKAIERLNRVLREARDQAGLTDAPIAVPAEKKARGGRLWLENQAVLMRRAFETDPKTGLSRMYVLSDSLWGPKDPDLEGKPRCFVEEASSWTYEVYDPARHKGMPKEIGNPNAANHAIDATSYGEEWFTSHDLPESLDERWGSQDYPVGSHGHMDQFWEWEN